MRSYFVRTYLGTLSSSSAFFSSSRWAFSASAVIYDESKYVLSTEERAEFESLAKAHAARVEALRACRAAPKPKPMASTPLEAEALALLEKQREGLSWSVSETDASGRPMPI